MFIPLVLMVAAAAPANEGSRAASDDLAQLQGVWELEFKQGEATIRVQKEVRGNRETLQTYKDGKLVHEHVVDFELSRAGGVKVFRWKNGENTFGPRKGAEMPDGGFIYRLTPEIWTNVYGFLPGEEEHRVFSEQYKKVGG
jgi:hypothetical protein